MDQIFYQTHHHAIDRAKGKGSQQSRQFRDIHFYETGNEEGDGEVQKHQHKGHGGKHGGQRDGPGSAHGGGTVLVLDNGKVRHNKTLLFCW